MIRRLAPFFVLAALLGGCASTPDVDTSRLVTDPLSREVGRTKGFDVMSKDDKVAAMKGDLEKMYATVIQKVRVAKVTAYGERRARYNTRKRVGLLAILLGAAAQTLNVESSENLVSVTALSALGGAATAYITTDNSDVDPMSSERVDAAMARIDENVAEYFAQAELLDETEKSTYDAWHEQYGRCVSALRRVELATHDILIPAGVGSWETD